MPAWIGKSKATGHMWTRERPSPDQVIGLFKVCRPDYVRYLIGLLQYAKPASSKIELLVYRIHPRTVYLRWPAHFAWMHSTRMGLR